MDQSWHGRACYLALRHQLQAKNVDGALLALEPPLCHSWPRLRCKGGSNGRATARRRPTTLALCGIFALVHDELQCALAHTLRRERWPSHRVALKMFLERRRFLSRAAMLSNSEAEHAHQNMDCCRGEPTKVSARPMALLSLLPKRPLQQGAPDINRCVSATCCELRALPSASVASLHGHARHHSTWRRWLKADMLNAVP